MCSVNYIHESIVYTRMLIYMYSVKLKCVLLGNCIRYLGNFQAFSAKKNMRVGGFLFCGGRGHGVAEP